MEEPGEQCTVVFALIVTETTSGCFTPHPSLAGSVITYAKTTVHCSPDFSVVERFFFSEVDVYFKP
jgi:hypothetical protein